MPLLYNADLDALVDRQCSLAMQEERERIIAILVNRYSIHEPYVGFTSEEDLRKALEP